jgi:cell division protein FtsI/penicillin-binding protein 2
MPALKGRIYLLLALTLIGFGLVLGKTFKIQVLDHGKFKNLVDRQTNQSTRLERQRGTIFDRRGRELAISMRVRSLAANPKRFVDASSRRQAAEALAPILGQDAAMIEAKLERPSEFVWLGRKLSDESAREIEALRIPGLHFETEFKRHYPHDSVAAHLIGFVGMDDEGLEGLERSMNDVLKGPDVEGRFIHDAYGNPIPVDGIVRYPRFNGQSVTLTIDLAIQTSLEEALRRQVEAYDAKSASGIVVDPATGEILALANVPTYDLNRVAASSSDERRNRAITDAFEPGSTFKIFGGALALDRGVVRAEEEFHCPGQHRVAGFTIRCHHAHGRLDYRRAIVVSCNVAAMLVSQRLEPAALHAGLTAFGFGRRTGIELPGEAAGMLRPVTQWSKLSLASLSLGQEVSVTTLQLCLAAAALANGGRAMAPHLVQSVRNAEGRVMRTILPEVRAKVASPEAVRQMSLMMEDVVSQGTGRLASVKLFRSAGKTGTGQISGPRGGYIKGRYNAVYVGWTPAEAPILSMAIVVHDPDPGKGYYGGQVAAPVFGWVGAESLRYLRVSARTGPDTESRRTAARTAIDRQAAIRGDQIVLPNLSGLTMREVHELLLNLPLHFRPRGSGVAVQQDPPAGTLAPLDTVITVEFAPPGGVEQFADNSPE